MNIVRLLLLGSVMVVNMGLCSCKDKVINPGNSEKIVGNYRVTPYIMDSLRARGCFAAFLFDGTGYDYADSGNSITEYGGCQMCPDRFERESKAVMMSGKNSFCVIPSTIEKYLNINQGDFTISVWVRTSDTSIGDDIDYAKHIVSAGEPFKKGLSLFLYNGRAGVSVGSSRFGLPPEMSTNINDNNWHHIAAVRSNGNVGLFVDNVLQYNYLCTDSIIVDGTVYVGRNSAKEIGFFKGELDELLLLNTALSKRDISFIASQRVK
jgi:hypothetical protein